MEGLDLLPSTMPHYLLWDMEGIILYYHYPLHPLLREDSSTMG